MSLRILIVLLLGAHVLCPSLALAESAWSGVDETVIERVAEEAGRPPRDPYINTDQGDILLFLFLLSGAVGGFIAGYAYRELFPPKAGAHRPDAPPR